MPKVCARCNGDGYLEKNELCPICDGRGCDACDQEGVALVARDCPECTKRADKETREREPRA